MGRSGFDSSFFVVEAEFFLARALRPFRFRGVYLRSGGMTHVGFVPPREPPLGQGIWCISCGIEREGGTCS